MEDPKTNAAMDWTNQPNYPRPDYLSSSRKRLAPQLLFKGGILHSWRKKMAVALNKSFFDTLPSMNTVAKSDAEIAWLIYEAGLPSSNIDDVTIRHPLSAVDGALIMTFGFDVVAFGARLTARPSELSPVIGPDGYGRIKNTIFEVDRYDTRHRSAFDFVSAQVDAVAFVI